MPVVNFSDIDFNKPIEEQSFNTPRKMPNIPDDEPIFSDDNFEENEIPPKTPKNLIFKEKDDIKLEKIKENKIDIIEYIGKLGKIFNKTINSSNWSDKVKKDIKNEFIKVEKYLKEQLKEEGKESIEKKPKGFRKYARKFFLTIPRTEAPKKEVLEYYLNNPKMNIQKAAIAQETHKTEKNGIEHHLHVYLEFCAKKDIRKNDFFNLPEEFIKYGNISTDWDTIKKRTKENVFSYMLKVDKKAYSYSFNIRKAALGKLKQKEIWYKIAIGEWTIKDYILYDPSILGLMSIDKLTDRYLKNLDSIKKFFNISIKEFLW